MARARFEVGEHVEMRCAHERDGRLMTDWLPGVVVQTDYRMAAVRFDRPVLSSIGHPVPDRVLWCTHGSQNIRRPDGRESEAPND